MKLFIELSILCASAVLASRIIKLNRFVKGIAHQEKFVPTSVGYLSSFGQNFGKANEFTGGELYLSREGVEVLNSSNQQFFGAWVGCIFEGPECSLGDVCGRGLMGGGKF